MNMTKDKINKKILQAVRTQLEIAADDYQRAELAIRGKSHEEVQELYGHSGKSFQEMFNNYKQTYDEWKEVYDNIKEIIDWYVNYNRNIW